MDAHHYPKKTTPKKKQTSKNLPKKKRSERILRQKLNTPYDGPGSTYKTALNIDEMDE